MKKYLILFLVLLLAGFVARAQNRCFKAYADPNHTYEIKQFCVGQTVYFKDCSGVVRPDQEYYDYDKSDDKDTNGDGIPDNRQYDTQKYYTYTKAGPVTVTQTANLEGDTKPFEQTFDVVDTPLPTFTTTACANKTFIVTITDKQYDIYFVKFGNEKTYQVYQNTPEMTATHTFNPGSPDNHQITVTGRYFEAICTSPNAEVTVTDLPAYTSPVINTLKVQNQEAATGSINFTFSKLLQGYTYTLISKSETESSFKTVATIAPNQTSYTLNNTNTTVKTEFVLEATDACVTVLPASNKAATIVLETTVGNEQVTVSWQSIAGFFQQYDLYRNGTLLKSVPGNTFNYTDTDVSCGQQNCYEVKGIASDGKATTVSAQSCLTVTSTATPPAPALYATFNLQNEVELTLQLPDGQSIKAATYQRSINSGTFKDLVTTTQTAVSDKLDPLVPVCYRAIFTNPCDKTSLPSTPACPVILTAHLNPDETVLLSWTNYSGFPDGVAGYSLEALDEAGNVLRTINVQGNTYTDRLANRQEQIFRYRIKAISPTGGVTYSNNETIKLELALFVPSGFTPNGDGLNDLFEIKGKRFESFTIRIMNRAGQVLYTSDDRSASWDGTFNGQPQPAGVYVYEISVMLQDGNTKRRTGTVTLLR